MPSTAHVMLDLETLGTKPGCPILSIGATTFLTSQFGSKQLFTETIQSHNQLEMDKPDPDTLSWWQAQSEEAKVAVFDNPDAIHIIIALTKFNNWLMNFKREEEDRILLWGNGATFDVPIIEEACKRYNIPMIWTFRDSLCFRTLKELGKMFNVQEPEFVGIKHNALSDACHQANWAERILRFMDA